MPNPFAHVPDAVKSAMGDVFIYTPKATNIPVSLVGVFIKEPIETFGSDNAPVQSMMSAMHVAKADISPVAGDTLIHDSITYTVNNVIDDGKGMIKLELHR